MWLVVGEYVQKQMVSSIYFCSLLCFLTGIWSRDIRYKSNLPLTEINKILKNLESKKLIKAVKSVAVSILWLFLTISNICCMLCMLLTEDWEQRNLILPSAFSLCTSVSLSAFSVQVWGAADTGSTDQLLCCLYTCTLLLSADPALSCSDFYTKDFSSFVC